jgi:hypothetical protein
MKVIDEVWEAGTPYKVERARGEGKALGELHHPHKRKKRSGLDDYLK